MKKVLCLVLAMCLLICSVPEVYGADLIAGAGSDYPNFYNEIEWTIDEEGVLTIQSDVSSLPTFGSLWGIYGPWRGSGAITKIIIPDTVTHIGERLFENCTNVKEVVLPKSLETIGDDAFGGCNSIEKITISDESVSLKTVDGVLFDNNGQRLCWYPVGKSDKEYTIPEGTREIKANAFENCIALEKVNFPSTLATIKPEAFLGCINLDNINLPDSVTYMGSGAFANCISLSNIKMPPYVYLHGNPFNNTAFYNNASNWEGDGLYINKHLLAVKDEISEYTIKPDTISVAGGVFSDTKNITSITIPGSVKCIGDRVFANNKSIASVTFEEGLEILGNGAFYWSHVENVTLPGSLKIIGGEAFYYSHLKSIIIPDNVIDIGESAFYSSNLESAIIGKSVTNIGSSAFSYCDKLKIVTIPDSVVTIQSGAFNNCRNLGAIYIGSGLQELPRFSNSNLSIVEISPDNPYLCTRNNVVFDKDVKRLIYYPEKKTNEGYIIPDGVEVIGESAFLYGKFKNLTIPQSVTKIESSNYCGSLTDIYYMGSKEEWDEIEIAKYNTQIQGAVVHFSDGSISNVHENLRLREEADKVYVIGLIDENTEHITIPGVINGKSVEIASGAFKNTNLVTVVLDERIKTIPYNAFYGCRKLESINLDYVERIDSQAFMYCESLKEVNLLNIKSWSGITEKELDMEKGQLKLYYHQTLYRYEIDSIYTVFYQAKIDTLRIKWPEVNFDEEATMLPALFMNCNVGKVIFENFTVSPSLAEFMSVNFSGHQHRFDGDMALNPVSADLVIYGNNDQVRAYADKIGVRYESLDAGKEAVNE